MGTATTLTVTHNPKLAEAQVDMKKRQPGRHRPLFSPAALPFIKTKLQGATSALTVDQIAELFGISPPFVHKLKNRVTRPLPSFRLGTARRFDPLAVLAWVEEEAA